MEQGEGYVAAKLAERVTTAGGRGGAEQGNKLGDIESALDINAGDRAF